MFPTLDTIQKMPLTGFYRFPVAKKIFSDFITPIQAMRILKSHSKQAFLLESSEDSKQQGRYSFLGFEPSAQITCKQWQVCIRSKDERLLALSRLSNDKNSVRERLDDDPDLIHTLGEKSICFQANSKLILREILTLYKSPKVPGMPPFSGGLVGYFAYDTIRYAEKTLDFPSVQQNNNCDIEDINLMLFEHLVVFDHFDHELFLVTNIDLQHLESSYENAHKKLESMQKILKSPLISSLASSHTIAPPFKLKSSIKSCFNEQEYCAMVERAKQYIIAGDIFQVVLSNPMQAEASGSLLDVYRILRTSNPSPYMFYLSSQNLEIAGASPETLVKLENDMLYTYPLAGSRPRGANEQEDKMLEMELLHDEKELAEHNMLVDLGRNDMGKVAQIGSVEVISYQHIVRYSHIMHIASSIRAKIAPDKDALDALEAILPAGTLSGAPKIRACEIINELEQIHKNGKRGIYGGAIGYLDFSGNMNTCIAIRLVYKQDDHIFVRTGAGIVYDSQPHKEFAETINKAKAVIYALERASEGIE